MNNKKVIIPLLIVIAAAIVIISVAVAMNSGGNNAAVQKPADAAGQTSAVTDENNDTDAQAEASGECFNGLSKVLDDIVATAAPGTAGGSLKAAIGASELLDFIYDSGYSAAELNSAAEKYASGMTDSAEKAEQFTDVASAVDSLKGEYAQDLLDDAGVTGSKYPWDDQTMDEAVSVLATLGAQIR